MRADSFAATVSTIAFAFYIQPIAMPMLREMPPGKAGYRVLSWSMRLVVGGKSSAFHVSVFVLSNSYSVKGALLPSPMLCCGPMFCCA